MALPATDNFDRANGALGTNWTGSVGSDLAISGSAVTGAAGSDSSMYWSADAPDAAQYAQTTYAATATWSGPTVRTSGTDWVMLDAAFQEGTKHYKIEWYNSGTFTAIGSQYNTTPTVGDTIKITASGSTYTGYINGTQRCTGSNAGPPSSGYGGIYVYGNAAKQDNFEVGNLTSAGTLAGTAAGVASQTGTLLGNGALVGSAAGVATASITLTGAGALAGAAASVASVVGTITGIGSGDLTGAAAGTSTAEATLAGAGALTGASAGTSTASATLASAGALTGTSAGVATASGTMAGAGVLTGASAGTGTANGILVGIANISDRDVSIDDGYTDVTPRQIVRTKTGYVYASTWKFDEYPHGGIGGSPYTAQTLKMYRGDQTGIPTSFTRKDSGNEPAGVVSWGMAIDGNDLIHLIWTVRTSWPSAGIDNYVRYCTFNPSTDTWGSVTDIETSAAIDEQGQGDELVAIAIDSSNVPHIVYLKDDGTRRRVTYRNKSGGTWSDATTIDDQSFGASEQCWHPGIVFDTSGRIVVTWMRGAQDATTTGRYFVRVYSGGSWGTTVDVTGANLWTGIDTGTPIYIDSSNRYHTCFITTDKDVLYYYSDDNGATWTANNPTSYTADNPTPGPGANGKVRIYCHDETYPYSIVYWEASGGSVAWGSPTSYSAVTSTDCSVAVRWSQYHNNSPSHLDILYWISNYPTNELYYGSDVSGTEAITGAAAGTSTVSGALTATYALSGTAAGTSTAEGTLSGAGALSGAVAGAAAVSGTLSGSGALNGSASGTASAVGTITGIGANELIGSITGTATVEGTLSGVGALAGTATGAATASGDLTLNLYATGAIAGVATAYATLTASSDLTGSAIATSTADATLTASGALVGSVTGTGYAVGTATDGAWHASGTRTVYKADKRADIEPTLRVSIMAED